MVHYTMIKRKKFFFISSLRSLHHDQERKKFFFISSLRSLHHDQEKKSFFFTKSLRLLRHDQEKLFFFISAQHSVRHGQKKKTLIFIAPLPWYVTIIKKYPFLISLWRSPYKYLLTSHYVTNEKVSKLYPPQKNMCNL